MNGTFTVTNNCGGTLWVRTKRNTTCDPGVTTYDHGDTWDVDYNNDDLACGTEFSYIIYINDPGTGCASSGSSVGGKWTYLCVSCPPQG
jgi:hypothetical protein